TLVAENRMQRQTAIALTPTEPIPTLMPLPTPTVELGLLAECPPPGSGREPKKSTCWRGLVNEQVISVAAGREGRRYEGLEQPTPSAEQGLVMVFQGPVFDVYAP